MDANERESGGFFRERNNSICLLRVLSFEDSSVGTATKGLKAPNVIARAGASSASAGPGGGSQRLLKPSQTTGATGIANCQLKIFNLEKAVGTAKYAK